MMKTNFRPVLYVWAVCHCLKWRVHSESDKPSCPAGIDETPGSELSWPGTSPGTTLALTCPHGASGNVTRTCIQLGGRVFWGNPDVTGCVNDGLSKLWETANKVVGRNNPEADDVSTVLEVLRQLTDEASQNHTFYPQDLDLTLDYLFSTAAVTDSLITNKTPEASIARFTQAFSDAMSSTCDNATKETWRNFNDPDKVLQNSKKILETMYFMNTNVIQLMKNSNATGVSAISKNINIDITMTESLNTAPVNDWPPGYDSDNTSASDSMVMSHVMRSASGDSTVIFPEEVIQISQQARPLFDGFNKAFSQVEYSTLYHLLEMADTNNDSSGNDWSSAIVTAQILNVDEMLFSNLSTPVVIIFRHGLATQEEIHNTGCYFVNETALLSEYIWSSRGCVLHDTNSTHTTCHCYHLTSFALIMDVFKADIPEVHQQALSYISYIGGTLSVTCCVVVIIIYEAFRLQNERIRIHEMLAITIALSQLNFFLGFERTENKAVCTALAISLHYILTSLFCWMLVEGLHLYQSLVKVFRRNSHFRKYLALGWGLPLVNVLICVLVFLDEYAAGDYCWLSNKLLIIGFIPFVVLTLFANTIVLIVVLRIMFRSLKSRNEDLSSIKTGFKATVILLPLLGLTWVFGFLSAGDEATLVFTYIFTVCNSLQGVFFFLFHCVMNTDVQNAFERKYIQHKCSRDQSQQSREGLSTLSHRVVEGDSVRRMVVHSKRSSASSTDSSGTNQTNMDSDFSTKDEFLVVKREGPVKFDKDWYNIHAQAFDDILTGSMREKNEWADTTDDTHPTEKLKKSSSTGKFRKRKRGVVRQDAIRRKNGSCEAGKEAVHGQDYKDDYLEWTRALEELDHVCNEDTGHNTPCYI